MSGSSTVRPTRTGGLISRPPLWWTGGTSSPMDAKITVSEWCDTWLQGYAGNRASTSDVDAQGVYPSHR